ncbi:MAG TPA: hypothetical protein PKB10_10155, partial [Tepidisphaeraceae bacterium]|nr:hypothetical protein [Tepidisphaeraceae bacterium]
VHEYAHALQIRDGLFFATRHVAFWGSLSGGQHADGTALDGYASGLFMMENPIELARLLLDGGRGESIYRPHRHARFINRYAAYDAREDFAESVRVFVYDPQTLIEVAPEKFLFINATGWCGALDASDPGPLWIDARQIIDRGWQTSLEQAARRIMWPTGDEPVVDLEVRAALLRAHADILRPEKLPPPHAASDLPDDLPKDLIDYYTADRLRPLVGGVVMHPDPQQLADEWQRALLMRLSREEWDASIFELTAGVLDQPARLHEAIAELTEMDDIELRQQQAARLLGHRVAWTTDPNAMRKATEREIAHLVDADRPLLADALRLHIADEAARAATMNGRSTDDLGAAATRAGASPDAIALHLALLEHEPNLAAADRIPGQALGMVRRTQFRFGLIEQLLAADNKEMAGVALRASLDELADSRHRHLVHALAGRARQLAVRIDDVALRQSVDALLQTGPGR